MGRSSVWGGRRKEFTVFVSNIPEVLDQFGLKGIFQRVGRVSDSYIPPRRSRKYSTRFGFVRFWRKADATRSVSLLNNARIRGQRIGVCLAKFGKNREVNRESLCSTRVGDKSKNFFWRKKNQVHLGVTKGRLNQVNTSDLFNIKGEVNPDFIDWLNRSLVCISDEPRDLGTLSSALICGFGECTKICAISSFKFILTLPSQDRVDELISNHEELDLWFGNIKKWDKFEFCESRRVWLEIFGVPPHGWTCENFRKIANCWGSFVCLGKSIERTDSFASMRVLIDTDRFDTIDADLVLSIDDAGYRIKIKEVGPTVQVMQAIQVPGSDRVSNHGVVGFEDLGDEVALGDDVEGKNWNVVDTMEDVNSRNEVNKSTGIQIISNMNKEGERPVGSPLIGSYSQSRTPTVCFSQNGFSEEIFKNPNQVEALKTCGVNEEPFINVGCEVHEGPQDKVLNVVALGEGEAYCEKSDVNLGSPLGFQPLGSPNIEKSEEPSVPPGFEGFINAKVSVGHKGCGPKSHSEFLVRRVTRSQSKQCKKQAVRSKRVTNRRVPSKEGKEGSPQVSDSVETTDSMRKLAEESLAVGELLGVKIIANKENAVKRITQSLKTRRSARPMRKTS